MIEFAQLHCHTRYSIQDAIPSNKAYVDAVYEQNKNDSEYNCIGLAVTEHGVLYSLAKHYNACNKPDQKERQTKAIYGCEVYHCVDLNNNPNGDRFHLVLLAKNQEGLTNLYKIVSHAGLNVVKGKSKNYPVTDLEFMKSNGKGIIALTACVGGLIPQCVINGKEAEAYDYLNQLKSSFDEVYLEVQPHEFPEQLLINHEFINMSLTTGCKLVMTSDSHYIKETDNKYHDILKNMAHQYVFSTNNHLYSAQEMKAYCLKYNIPLEAISNSAEIAKVCNVDPKPKDHNALLPVFPCPPGYDEASYLRKLSFEGLKDRLKKNKIDDPLKYIRKMTYELEIICNAGFAGYFLILSDWLKWCRQNDILCGPGRGSAAGSIVSYALNITTVDPIKNGFFFER